MNRTHIKICGITRLKDALEIANLGVGALGFIIYPPSKRYIAPPDIADIVASLPPFIQKIGVFVNHPLPELIKIMQVAKLNLAQLHGDESVEYTNQLTKAKINWYKAIRLKNDADLAKIADYSCHNILIDSWQKGDYGGTGKLINHKKFANLSETIKSSNKQIILAGGLNADNILNSITDFRPVAVDVSSGVEDFPGKKNIIKVTNFIKALEKS
ncbi:MAG: phosphoribosylanthranilate isomerase [SAR324 cluster bacterium]|nr:phosphoribosylanthranilate isomerase [SAR324 cluster bacterium]